MENNMVKLDEILEAVKYKEAAKKKEEKKTCILWILAIIGIVAAVAAVAYAVYRYLTPDYLEDFDDDFDDDFEDEDLDKEEPEKEASERGLRIAETCHQEQIDHGFCVSEYPLVWNGRNAIWKCADKTL